MKKRFLFLSLLAPYFAESQVIISKWTMNKDGKKGTYWAQMGERIRRIGRIDTDFFLMRVLEIRKK